mmetsp:Transcript_45552/g.67699  ORF Transcript_45552/g.67699 Transcript_45552/m.67699 type:complete len:484 (-) Transcript_45552:25-1476(-)
MVSVAPLRAFVYLLASIPKQQRRYKGSVNKKSVGNRSRRNDDQKRTKPQASAVVLPSLTEPISGPFPTYYTCRHTYEDTLMEELKRWTPSIQLSSPCPGLVQVDGTPRSPLAGDNDVSPTSLQTDETAPYDPVYALQALPDCRIVTGESVKKLAIEVASAVETSSVLKAADASSLSIHALVPGMCKGQREPQGQRRAYLVADAVQELLKKQYPAARRQTLDVGEQTHSRILLQILLLSTELAAVSLTECSPITSTFSTMLWPNPNLPAGLAMVDMIRTMPSSAYRKLLEAFSCWNCMPSPEDVVVDLGASPGGWTAALLHICQSKRIIAVDRSELDPELMSHPAVEFVQGDAFTFLPNKPLDWMLSDVIAFPERVVELVDAWCSKGWAGRMIITVKFKGTKPSWEPLQLAVQTAQSHGYDARAKHFFNNKNEVTLMLQKRTTGDDDDCNNNNDTGTTRHGDSSSPLKTTSIRGPIYNVAWKST